MTPPEPPVRPGAGATAATAAVRCRGVVRSYHLDGSDVPALRGVDLDLPAGSFTALMGPSGSGKSTLLRLLACVDRPDSGSIEIDGQAAHRLSVRGRVRLRRRRLGYVFQAPGDNLLEYLTVRGHLRLGAQLRGLSARTAQVDRMLDWLGLTRHADRLPRQLSGGEQQRVAIGFAAIGPPALLIADEPTGQLDHSTVDSVLDALAVLAGNGMAVVAATHDRAVARRADTVVLMRDGVIEQATS